MQWMRRSSCRGLRTPASALVCRASTSAACAHPLTHAQLHHTTFHNTGIPKASPPPPTPSPPPRQEPPAEEHWSAALPDIPYGFPASHHSLKTSATAATHPYAAEQSGGVQKKWLRDLARGVATAQVTAQYHVPNKDDFCRSPPYEALREVVLRTPYHDALKIIMEHDYTFLFADVMCNGEAPMPHVIYEDFMKALTFSSRQRPPEEQFALSSEILRDLLCWAAYYCTLDKHYFTSASLFFHKVEQEQHLSPAIHSAWVYICTAAGKREEALAYATYMDRHDIAFDPDVFAYLLHPSLTPVQHHLRHAPQTSKGVVLQRRLCLDMQQHHGTAAVAVHAMFVYHMLTLRHTEKWEVLREAAELHTQVTSQQQQPKEGQRISQLSGWTADARVTAAAAPAEMISSRTMQLALSLFCREKGIRWGARTTKAMVTYMITEPAAGATAADILFVLMRVRRNEQLPMLAGLPSAAFTAAEQDALMQAVYRASRSDPSYAVAAPLLQELLSAGGAPLDSGDAVQLPSSVSRRGGAQGIQRAMQQLQELSLSLDEECAHDDWKGGSATRASHPQHSADEAGNRAALSPEPTPTSTPSTVAAAPSRAEVTRDLLEAVMALDRESAPPDGAATATATAEAAPTTADGMDDDTEMQLASLQSSMTAMGASASLSTWAMQQAAAEAEEARLREQVQTAWIAPAHRP